MNLNSLKVSIIVPVYNAQEFLDETVSSVLKQTFKNFELILINDGSTDNSLSIIEKLKSSDSRIRVLSQVNKGVTAARKLGITHSVGDYITFLDSDDSFYPNSLEILVNELKEDDYDIINGSFVSVPGGRKWIHKDIQVMNNAEYFASIIFNQTYLAIYASLYKKVIFQETIFEFNENFKIGEDVLMNIEIGSRAKNVKNISDIVYKYNVNNANSAMTIIERHPDYYKRFFSIQYELYKKFNFDIFMKYQSIIEKQNNNVIISSFFSPHIDFSKSLFLSISKLRFYVKSKNFYTFCLFNFHFSHFIKYLIKFIYFFKNFLLNRNLNKVILK